MDSSLRPRYLNQYGTSSWTSFFPLDTLRVLQKTVRASNLILQIVKKLTIFRRTLSDLGMKY